MSSILDRYGIKEVADVTFYNLDEAGQPTHPVLFLDTLKVSTIEQTAESAEARGGKGNAPLIVWDYGKEISVTLEDALFSPKSLAIMFGDKDGTIASGTGLIMKTKLVVAKENYSNSSTATADGLYRALGYTLSASEINPKIYDEVGASVVLDANNTNQIVTQGKTYMITYDVPAKGMVIDVSANSFPGTYYVTGDTYVRSEASGNDEYFQFIIPKAKVTPESNTITLEAEGDPSVFNMNLKVLRPKDGVMMKLVKYEIDSTVTDKTASLTLLHNHKLAPVTPASAE